MESPKAKTRSGFPWRWLVLGVVSYGVFVLATFPAARLTERLQKNGVTLAGVSGTIWNGTAGAVQANGMVLGAAEWHVSPWRLLLGTLSAELHSKREDGYLDITVRKGLGGKLSLHDVHGSLPIAALSSFGIPGGSGWTGTIQVDIQTLAIVNRWPTEIKGTIEAANLVGPAQQPTQLGGYRITFPASDVATAGELQGAVKSLDDAPLDVIGAVRLTADRNYVIDAQVATRPTAPASIVKALQYLGPPDAQGRRPLSLAGSF